MPVESSGLHDPLTRITELRTSTIIELLSGLQILSHRWRKSEWKTRAANILGQQFMENLLDFTERYGLFILFVEISIDYPDNHDVPGYIAWIRTLPDRTLAFYILGRLYPLSIIPDPVNRESIDTMIARYPLESCFECLNESTLWADEIETVRRRIASILSEYWEKFFINECGSFKEYWDRGNRELETLLVRSGGTALYSKFFGNTELPPRIPEDTPYTSIHYIPIYRLFRPVIKFFGYGNITVLYDCTLDAEAEKSIEAARKKALMISKALADERRLQILKLIAGKEFGLNGKTLAEKMALSASVVSRHLSQLKEAELITEKSADNRNITYRLNWKNIDEYSAMLIKYLGNS